MSDRKSPVQPGAAPRLPHPDTPPAEQDAASRWFIEQMVAMSDGDDEELLRLCAEGMQVVDDHRRRVRDVQVAAASRLRDQGKPMKDIAKVARVSDSWLSREILNRGGTRRSDRRKRKRGNK